METNKTGLKSSEPNAVKIDKIEALLRELNIKFTMNWQDGKLMNIEFYSGLQLK